ncbi:MAG: hypothetical protein ACREA0_19265, partial [bacterium]
MSDKDSVTKILQEAFEAVTGAGLPKEVQGMALGKAVDLMTAGTPAATRREVTKEDLGADPGDLLGKIAAKYGVDRDLVEDAYDVEEGKLSLAISRAKLAGQKAKGTKQIALLVAAGRQAAGLETSTETKVIRPIVD